MPDLFTGCTMHGSNGKDYLYEASADGSLELTEVTDRIEPAVEIDLPQNDSRDGSRPVSDSQKERLMSLRRKLNN